MMLAACVAAPPPAPVPRPVAVAPPRPAMIAAPAGSDWRDWAVTPGDWVYRQDARGSIALFGGPGSDALVTLRCDRAAGMVYLSRAGAATAPVTVRTTSMARSLAARPTGSVPDYVAVALAPRDALLDAMAFSRGRFIVEQPGAPTLVIPAWAEVPRVVEDCRR